MNEYNYLKPGQWWGIETIDGGAVLYDILERDNKFLVYNLYRFWEDGYINVVKETLTKRSYEFSTSPLRTKAYIIDSHLMRMTLRLMFGEKR